MLFNNIILNVAIVVLLIDRIFLHRTIAKIEDALDVISEYVCEHMDKEDKNECK